MARAARPGGCDLQEHADDQQHRRGQEHQIGQHHAEQPPRRGLFRTVHADRVQDAASMSTLFSCGVDYVEGDFLALPSAEMNYEFE